MTERKAPVWWGIPQRFSDRGRDRKISWLELFYDLVYAGSISQLTEHLAKHPDIHGLTSVLFLFTFLYWAWMNGSLYHDLHGNAGVRSRLTTLWQMMSIAAVAVTIPDVFSGNHRGFAISFSVVELMITFLWWSTGYYDPDHKKLNFYYVLMYSISFILLVISIFVPYHTALVLWAVALASNLSTGILSTHRTQSEMLKRGESFSMSNSMIERFGLLTMIVLGEAILGIIHGMGSCHETSFMAWLCFALSVFVTFLLWWIYFDVLGESTAKPGYLNFLFLTFGYIPLLAAFAVIGASIRVMLSDIGTAPHLMAKSMFGMSVVVVLLSTVLISIGIRQDAAQAKAMQKILYLIAVTSVLVMVVTVIGWYVSVALYLGLMAVCLLTSIALSFRIWMGYGLFTEDGL